LNLLAKWLTASMTMTGLCLVPVSASTLPERAPLPPTGTTTLPERPPLPPRKAWRLPSTPPLPPFPAESPSEDDRALQSEAAPRTQNPTELCGDAIDGLIIQAEVAPPISDGACGRDDVLKVKALGTSRPIPIAGSPRMSCSMAASLARWLGDTVAGAAREHLDSPLAGLPPGVSYACRSRNHQPGARLSEHAKANAFDIRAFLLDDGRAIPIQPIDGEDNVPDEDEIVDGEVEEAAAEEGDTGPVHDPDSAEAAFQREIRAAACGPFKTVLGPGADAFHDDHLHLDMAERRNRSTYCR
jgi:hypothetical protein